MELSDFYGQFYQILKSAQHNRQKCGHIGLQIILQLMQKILKGRSTSKKTTFIMKRNFHAVLILFVSDEQNN